VKKWYFKAPKQFRLSSGKCILAGRGSTGEVVVNGVVFPSREQGSGSTPNLSLARLAPVSNQHLIWWEFHLVRLRFISFAFHLFRFC
jgi:hypothetical protein